MKLRKNAMIALMAGLLALGGVACGGDDTAEETDDTTDTMTEGGDMMTEEMMTE